ncbi:hypothetical protein HPB47_015529 [Ixodes persulcatus]|uniref:Uncharacterized protein n=1 Tax=Ixodes persulcatus TaxID=34615 RepID=A0AC60QWV1_IXOPE|nr:hypothetical protein HPB47_015529 [Ixodes persulcatus]
MERARASPEPSRIPVFRSGQDSGPWQLLESKLKRLDEQQPAKPDPYARLLAGICKDSVLLLKQLQTSADSLRTESAGLKQQLRKAQQRIDELGAAETQLRELRADLARLDARTDASFEELRGQLRALGDKQSEQARMLDRIPDAQELSRQVRQDVAADRDSALSRLEAQLEKTSGETGKQAEELRTELRVLADRLVPLESLHQVAEVRQQLLDEAELAGAQRSFQELQLLRGMREAPFRWQLAGYQRLREQARREGQLRLYSRPFGIEREGAVRCVLRLAASVGVPAGQEGGDAVQIGLELLHSAKLSKKFDFCLRLLDRSGQDRHLVKTFSSSELIVPRYWFSRPASGLVSFALLVSEQRLLREGLLFKDTLSVEVGIL